MTATTAMVFVGTSTWDGGIEPSHVVHLREGFRCSWVLLPSETCGQVKWDVDPGRLLDELQALLGIHVFGAAASDELRADYVNTARLSQASVRELDAAVTTALDAPRHRVAVVAFAGSSLRINGGSWTQAPDRELELCEPMYERWFSDFSGQWNERSAAPSVAQEG